MFVVLMNMTRGINNKCIDGITPMGQGEKRDKEPSKKSKIKGVRQEPNAALL